MTDEELLMLTKKANAAESFLMDNPLYEVYKIWPDKVSFRFNINGTPMYMDVDHFALEINNPEWVSMNAPDMSRL